MCLLLVTIAVNKVWSVVICYHSEELLKALDWIRCWELYDSSYFRWKGTGSMLVYVVSQEFQGALPELTFCHVYYESIFYIAFKQLR